MTRRERRIVALGAVVALVIIGYWLFSRPPGETGADMAADQAALLARLRGLVEQRPEIEASLEQARAEQQRMRAYLFPGTNPNLAGAALSRLVEEAARASGLHIERTQIRNPEMLSDALQKISVTVQLSGSIHGLRSLLHALEGSPRMVSVETLRVTALGRGSASGASDSPAPLSLEMRVVGYSLPAEAEASAG